MAEWLFWGSLIIIFYAYLGYGILITILARLKQAFFPEPPFNPEFEPSVSLIVASYNEADFIREKAQNMLELDYPPEKMQIIFVTDGSDDDSPDILREYKEFQVLHKPERAGKIAAMERSVEFAENEILIFSDANAMLNKEAVRNIVRHYYNPKVGAVAGEKRIIVDDKESASGSGEGIYWKYESYLKKKDYQFYSVVGAAGELFSVRKNLYEPTEPDSILDDFMISMRVAEKGYRVAYEPEAAASELPSVNVEAEWTRKTRIAAGGFQSTFRLLNLLNPFSHGRLSFQFFSHRVLRWVFVPFLFIVVFITNLVLFNKNLMYQSFFFAQILVFMLAVTGYYLENRKIRFKLLFIPYYVMMMNAAVLVGLKRFLSGKQTVLWKKAERAKKMNL